MLPFISWTWVTEAGKDGGTIEFCSIATLLKITSVFSQRAFGQKKPAKYFVSRLH
jgi:hypothetical protein